MVKIREEWKRSWDNTFYRATVCYVAILVTAIFILQVHPYVFDTHSGRCAHGNISVSKLVPVVGVRVHAKS